MVARILELVQRKYPGEDVIEQVAQDHGIRADYCSTRLIPAYGPACGWVHELYNKHHELLFRVDVQLGALLRGVMRYRVKAYISEVPVPKDPTEEVEARVHEIEFGFHPEHL